MDNSIVSIKDKKRDDCKERFVQLISKWLELKKAAECGCECSALPIEHRWIISNEHDTVFVEANGKSYWFQYIQSVSHGCHSSRYISSSFGLNHIRTIKGLNSAFEMQLRFQQNLANLMVSEDCR